MNFSAIEFMDMLKMISYDIIKSLNNIFVYLRSKSKSFMRYTDKVFEVINLMEHKNLRIFKFYEFQK